MERRALGGGICLGWKTERREVVEEKGVAMKTEMNEAKMIEMMKGKG